jgi:hypothetical protein
MFLFGETCMVRGIRPQERPAMNDTDEPGAGGAAVMQAVPGETVAAILAAVDAGDHEALVALLEPLHEADVADLLEQITRPQRKALIELWGVELDGAVLYELEEGVRDEVLAELPDPILAAAVQEMETDDVVTRSRAALSLARRASCSSCASPAFLTTRAMRSSRALKLSRASEPVVFMINSSA